MRFLFILQLILLNFGSAFADDCDPKQFYCTDDSYVYSQQLFHDIQGQWKGTVFLVSNNCPGKINRTTKLRFRINRRGRKWAYDQNNPLVAQFSTPTYGKMSGYQEQDFSKFYFTQFAARVKNCDFYRSLFVDFDGFLDNDRTYATFGISAYCLGVHVCDAFFFGIIK